MNKDLHTLALFHNKTWCEQRLKMDHCSLLSDLSDSIYKEVRQCNIKCILATDMAKHGDIIAHSKKIHESGFNINDNEHRSLVWFANTGYSCRSMG